MSLFRSASLALVFAAVLAHSLAAQVQVSYPLLTDDEIATELRLKTALAKRVSYDFQGTPFTEVIEKLADDSGIPFVITKKIEDAGVEPNQPITRKLSNVTLRSFLRLLLGDLNLTWMWKDDVIKITTIEDACSPENLVIRLYPVQDLVDPVQKTKDVKPTFDFAPLCQLITTSIEADSWQDVGGPGFVEPFHNAGCLVISQREDVHDRVERLILTLRKVKEVQGLNKQAPVPPANRYLTPAK